MKKLFGIISIFFCALNLNAQTTSSTMSNAQIVAKFVVIDTNIARANRNISTLFAQNDSYKNQLLAVQSVSKKQSDTINMLLSENKKFKDSLTALRSAINMALSNSDIVFDSTYFSVVGLKVSFKTSSNVNVDMQAQLTGITNRVITLERTSTNLNNSLFDLSKRVVGLENFQISAVEENLKTNNRLFILENWKTNLKINVTTISSSTAIIQ